MQDKKTLKYDRQLRLWQSYGQSALEKAHVCLIQASAAGAETLKNLVLPGIGAFTIVDDQNITENDLSHCFFLHPSKLGQSRAKCMTAYLCEMNEEVVGHYVEEESATLLLKNPDFFLQFQLIYVSGSLPESLWSMLMPFLWNHSIPLVLLKLSGFVASIQPIFSSHLVVHKEIQVRDLRLHQPWPELANFVLLHDFSHMDGIDLAHVPFPVILLKLYPEFSKQHPAPPTSAQIRLFRSFLANYKNTLPVLASSTETYANWDEAINMAYLLFPTISDSERLAKLHLCLESVLEAKKPVEYLPLCTALQTFLNKYHRIPLFGKVPDMTSDTQRYLALQKIYQEKARSDHELLQEILPSSFSLESIVHFCQSIPHLQFLCTPSYEHTNISSGLVSDHVEAVIIEEMLTGVRDLQRGMDMAHFQQYMEPRRRSLVQQHKQHEWSQWDDWIQEFERSGTSELASTASVVGGVAAQEGIKLITGQYVPFTGVWVYNGIQGTSCLIPNGPAAAPAASVC